MKAYLYKIELGEPISICAYVWATSEAQAAKFLNSVMLASETGDAVPTTRWSRYRQLPDKPSEPLPYVEEIHAWNLGIAATSEDVIEVFEEVDIADDDVDPAWLDAATEGGLGGAA